MINLFLVEKLIANTATELVPVKCAVKKLCVTLPTQGSGNSVVVVFRDGGPAGEIRARLSITAENPNAMIECSNTEIILFRTSIFVQVAGTAAVGAYLVGNPVGPASVPA